MNAADQHTIDRLRAELRQAEDRLAQLRRPQSSAERDEIAAAHARADAVARQFGGTASAAVPGETSLAYRKRLAAAFQPHSASFRDARLDSMDAATLRPVEDAILREASAKAADPASYPAGTLRAVQERDSSGRTITKWVGDPMAWMAGFMGGGGVVGRFVRNPKPAGE